MPLLAQLQTKFRIVAIRWSQVFNRPMPPIPVAIEDVAEGIRRMNEELTRRTTPGAGPAVAVRIEQVVIDPTDGQVFVDLSTLDGEQRLVQRSATLVPLERNDDLESIVRMLHDELLKHVRRAVHLPVAAPKTGDAPAA